MKKLEEILEDQAPPQGPRPEHLVQTVGADETVLRQEHGEAIVSRAAGPDLVMIPGGPRHKSLIHVIEPGHEVRFEDGKAYKVELATNRHVEIGDFTVPGGSVARQAVNWITFASWTNKPGNPVTSFTTTWTVPPAPTDKSGQIIFLFNGMTNSAGILQPVLTWGANGAGTGNFWSVANWFVPADQTKHIAVTKSVRVNEGDTLVGIIRLTGQSGGKFSYSCEFKGLGNNLYMINIPGGELNLLVETLEAYGKGGSTVLKSSYYPATIRTRMRQVEVQTTKGYIAMSWTPLNVVTDFGQNTEAVDNNGVNGIIDLYYGSRLYKYHGGDGSIWQYIASGGWRKLDQNGEKLSIAAADGNLYKLQSGSIWKYSGPPGTGWQMLDNNRVVPQ